MNDKPLQHLHDNLFLEPPVKNWSFSSLSKFEACPYATLLDKVEKAPKPNYADDPDHPLTRGTRIHQEAEDFVRGIAQITPSLTKHFNEEFIALKDMYDNGMVELEGEWGFKRDWSEIGFFEDGVWHRAKLDAFIRFEKDSARLIDYKTGKQFGNEVKHTMQAQQYSIDAFMRMPELEFIEAEFWYLDTGGKLIKRYQRDNLLVLLPRVEERAERMTLAQHFPPKPNRMNCRFCDFGPTNGTDVCPYGVGQE